MTEGEPSVPCACRERAPYGSVPRKGCAWCGGCGYVYEDAPEEHKKDWSKDTTEDPEW